MSKKKIVFQGEPGANSHLAITEAYPGAEAIPCATFEDCFAAVRTGRAELAMIPIENSIAGRVADIHHLMPTSKLHIVGEHFMPVHHQLLAIKGANRKTLKSVESHVHALGQCRNAIRKLGIRAVVAADTAGSAREISQAGDKTRASIATKLAAKIYGLRVLAANIEDADAQRLYTTVLSAYCADSATADLEEWQLYMRRIIELVRPGGTLLVAALGKTHSYLVGGRAFPSPMLGAADMERMLRNCFPEGALTIRTVHVPECAQHGYSSIILAAGHRRRPTSDK